MKKRAQIIFAIITLFSTFASANELTNEIPVTTLVSDFSKIEKDSSGFVLVHKTKNVKRFVPLNQYVKLNANGSAKLKIKANVISVDDKQMLLVHRLKGKSDTIRVQLNEITKIQIYNSRQSNLNLLAGNMIATSILVTPVALYLGYGLAEYGLGGASAISFTIAAAHIAAFKMAGWLRGTKYKSQKWTILSSEIYLKKS